LRWDHSRRAGIPDKNNPGDALPRTAPPRLGEKAQRKDEQSQCDKGAQRQADLSHGPDRLCSRLRGRGLGAGAVLAGAGGSGGGGAAALGTAGGASVIIATAAATGAAGWGLLGGSICCGGGTGGFRGGYIVG
jgi:hypothetical protein